MLEEKTLVSPDVELGMTALEPDNIGEDQRLYEVTSQEINTKSAGEAPDGGLKAWSVIAASMLTTFCTSFRTITSEFFYPIKVHLLLCTFLTAECAQYWQFFLAQGLFSGLFSGIIYGQAISVVSHWFTKKRGTALGVVSIGSSLGGTLFPIAAQNLIPHVGSQVQVDDRRLPPVNVKGGLLNLSAFRNPAYSLYCVSGIVSSLGLFTTVGVSTNFSFYLVAIANAASGFGRLSAGKLADHIGPLNAMIPFISLAGILTCVWPYVSSQEALIGISVIYGFASGTFISLVAAPPMAMGDVGDVGRRVGMCFTISALGSLVGTPISGLINARTEGYKGPGLYAGGVVIFSTLLLLVRLSAPANKIVMRSLKIQASGPEIPVLYPLPQLRGLYIAFSITRVCQKIVLSDVFDYLPLRGTWNNPIVQGQSVHGNENIRRVRED
ncbi:MFS general substrate transporter [Pisolithus marmoratus]|nr:MFS general substrate transporter [Pisolithus marmoratus]